MELKIASIGNVDSAKSTTISCICNNILDDGKGFARKKVMKHKHETNTGRTSCISQNYIKIKNKIIGFVDLAGHEKYLKTTARGLSSSFIDYGMLTIGGERGIIGMTKEHIILSLALEIPFFIVITKIDITPDHKLERILKRLGKIMSSKGAGNKKCVIVDENTDLKTLVNFYEQKIIPIFCISNITGKNLDLVKKFIFSLNPRYTFDNSQNSNSVFKIDDVFKIVGVGIVLSGKVNQGKIRVGDKLYIGPFNGEFKNIVIKNIHDNFRNDVKFLSSGESGCINIKQIESKKQNQFSRKQIKTNMICIKNPKCIREFDAEITILNHPTTIKTNYQPYIHCGSVSQSAQICSMDKKLIRTGDKAKVKFKFMFRPEYIEKNAKIVFREGKTKGIGKIIDVKYV